MKNQLLLRFFINKNYTADNHAKKNTKKPNYQVDFLIKFITVVSTRQLI